MGTAFEAVMEVIIMSVTLVFSHSSAGFSPKTGAIPVFDFGAIFGRSAKGNANEVILINKTSPIDRPETVRFATKKIADTYKNSGISLDLQNATKSGSQTVRGLEGTYKKVDSVTGKVTHGIYKCHIVSTFTDDPEITDEDKLAIELRVVGLGCRSTGGTPADVASNLTNMAMGGIIPAGV